MSLDRIETRLLAVIERKPYKAYTQSQLTPFTNGSLTEQEALADTIQSRLQHLVELGLVREKTLYFSPKAKI